jgi:S-DNA-T family DNA segregation ATPase FtsK/SpoIIIE
MYGFAVMTSGFWLWGLWQLALKRRMTRRLTQVFLNSGLRTVTGRLPSYIFDKPIDGETRKLRLKRMGISVRKFKDVTADLEGDLQIFVDEIRENRVAGTVDVIYSHHEMPDKVSFADVGDVAVDQIVVGKSRASQLQIHLEKVPHLLVAGQTGGGKSTFLRQMITTLYLRSGTTQFALIDLKGGLEFQLFRDLARVDVIDSAGSALKCLEALNASMDDRIKTLAANRVKDFPAFLALGKGQRIYPEGVSPAALLGRRVVVIDEVAELFLAGGAVNSEQSKRASEIVSRISRLGRAPGIHLVLGTQRPDKRALDTQIKANLPGKLCFQMTDTASSMVVLGNARARDLPSIPGRAIWQNGLTMVEVQTPMLGVDEANALLSVHRKQVVSQKSKTPLTQKAPIKERS